MITISEIGDNDETPEGHMLGTHETNTDGGNLTARFEGTGVLTTKHTEGSFLSDRRLQSRFDKPEKTLSIEEMFPEGWQDKRFNYVITVKATMVGDNPKNK